MSSRDPSKSSKDETQLKRLFRDMPVATTDIPVEDRSKGVFEDLPLSIQRAIINRARQAKDTTIIYKDKVYDLPTFSQVTYRCTNQRCQATRPMRLYTKDLIHSNISNNIKCHMCRYKMEVILMSATLDHSLEIRRKKKGLYKHFVRTVRSLEDDSNA